MNRNKILTSFAVMALLCTLALAIPSCKSSEVAPPDDTSQNQVDPAAAKTPTQDEVVAAYKKASTAYSWFAINTIPVDGENQKKIGEMTYQRVKFEGINSMAELRSYLLTMFTDEMTAKILAMDSDTANPRYQDVDGVLYALPSARGANILLSEERFSLVTKDATNIVLVVEVDEYDNPETKNIVNTIKHEFNYTAVDGKSDWRFSTFESVY
ncbi:MAG: hypothetical protein RR998_02020 [Oscillospiraceae bacterium]